MASKSFLRPSKSTSISASGLSDGTEQNRAALRGSRRRGRDRPYHRSRSLRIEFEVFNPDRGFRWRISPQFGKELPQRTRLIHTRGRQESIRPCRSSSRIFGCHQLHSSPIQSQCDESRAPGLTNVMAAAAATKLERIDSIRIRVGGIDFTQRRGDFVFPYSAQTIIEELTLPAWKWSRGRFVQVKPRSGWERVEFGPPVGAVWAVTTRHSEI